MNQRKIGAALGYISLVLGNIVSLIYTPIMLSLLGKNEYGLYSLAGSIIGYLGLLNFGFTGSYIRFYSRAKANKDLAAEAKLNGMFLMIFSAISLLVLVIGIVLVFNSDAVLGSKLTLSERNTGKTLLAIMVANMFLSLPATVFHVFITANEKFVFQKLIGIIQIIVAPLSVLPVLFLGYGAVGMVVVNTLLTVVFNVSNLIYAFRKLRIQFDFNGFDTKLLKEMSLFSSFIFLNIIIDQINWNVDNYILGRVQGVASVAVYSIGASLNRYYLAFAAIIMSVYVPHVNRLVAEKDDNKELLQLMIKTGRIQFLFLILLFSGFVFFGRSFINLWVGAEYDDAYFIAAILMGAATIPYIQSVGIEIQQAKNKHRFRSTAYFIIAIVNVALSIPLAKMYGGIGSALGTATALLIGNGLIINWYYHKKIGLDIIAFWREIFKFLPALVFPVAAGLWAMESLQFGNFASLITAMLIYGAVYVLSMWFFAMNHAEKKQLERILLRLKTRKA